MRTRPGIYRAPGEALRRLLPPIGVAALLLLWACALLGQEPVLEVRLNDQAVRVVGRLSPAGALELPASPIEELTGEDLTPKEWLTLGDLRRGVPAGVTVRYRPELALVVINDPYAALASTRAALQSARAQRGAVPVGGRFGGPWAEVLADRDGDYVTSAGAAVGRVAVDVQHSSLSGDRWGLSVMPAPAVWATYRDGGRQPATLDLRAAPRWLPGSTLVTASYTPARHDWRARLSASIGRWSGLVTSDRSAALGYSRPGWSLMVGTSDIDQASWAVRLAVGSRGYPTLSIPRVH